jgi:hypothetical protein
MARLVRKQIYIATEQDQRLREMAARDQRSQAEIVRDALDLYLGRRRKAPRRRADDPLWDIVGLGASDASDVSMRADHYLGSAGRK